MSPNTVRPTTTATSTNRSNRQTISRQPPSRKRLLRLAFDTTRAGSQPLTPTSSVGSVDDNIAHVVKVARLTPAAADGSITPIDAARTPPAKQTVDKERIGPYMLNGTVASLLAAAPTVQHYATDTRDGTAKHIQLMNATDYARYTQLVHRLGSGRERWAPYSNTDLLDYDRLRACLLGGCEAVTDAHGRHYFVEPVAVHGSLHTHIQLHKALDERLAHSLFRQLIAVLAFCHRLGIMVRDLKLRKLVFADAAHTTLRLCTPLDLHVCINWDDDTLSDRHGCPAYVSPEIINVQQAPFSGAQADMWSAGVLLYVMLVGRYPFYDTTAQRLFDKIRTGEFCVPLALDCTLDARIIMHSLLRLQPSRRPSAMNLLRTAWMQPGAIDKIHQLAPLSANARLLLSAEADDQVVPS